MPSGSLRLCEWNEGERAVCDYKAQDCDMIKDKGSGLQPF